MKDKPLYRIPPVEITRRKITYGRFVYIVLDWPIEEQPHDDIPIVICTKCWAWWAPKDPILYKRINLTCPFCKRIIIGCFYLTPNREVDYVINNIFTISSISD
jgi:hypothetical protein